MNQLTAIAEQKAFREQQREERRIRLLAAARRDEDISCSALGKRFGVDRKTVERLLHDAGIKRPPSGGELPSDADIRRCNAPAGLFLTSLRR